MIKGFRDFILRGNVVDLAVGIVIGVAFGTVIAALVKDLITPIIGAIGGKPDFSALSFTVNKSRFLYGDFLNAIIAFLLIAAAVYFFVITPVNKLMAKSSPVPKSPPGPKSARTACPRSRPRPIDARSVQPTSRAPDGLSRQAAAPDHG